MLKLKSVIRILFISFLLLSFQKFSNAQKVIKVEYESQADLKVYVVDYESQCDLKVYFVEYESQAKKDGLWYVVKYETQADYKIFFVEYESQADLKIFFVPYESQAGWKDLQKQYLLKFKSPS